MLSAGSSLTREQLLQIRDRADHRIQRSVRKTLIKNNIWCPESERILPIKQSNSINIKCITWCGLLNPRSVNKKELVISELLCENNLDFLALIETWWPFDPEESKVSKGLITPSGYEIKDTPCLTRVSGNALFYRDTYRGKILEFK